MRRLSGMRLSGMRPDFDWVGVTIIINESFYYLFKPELSIIYNIAYAENYTVINASSLGFSAIILRQTSTLVRALYPSPRARGFTARARAYRFVYVINGPEPTKTQVYKRPG